MQTKYRMYIDESGNSDMGSCNDSNHRFLCLCGVILDLEYVNSNFQPEFESFKEAFFGRNADSPVILHRSDILNHRGAFHVLKDEDVKNAFNTRLLENLAKWEFAVIVVLIDKKEFDEKYHGWKEHPYHYCLQVLVERFCSFLRQNCAIGDVMIEARNKNDDKLLKGEFKKIYEEGTNYWQGVNIQKYISSTQIKIRAKATNIAGLQLADLVVQPMRNRILDKYELRQRADALVFGDAIVDRVENKIYKGKNGEVWGYGLKKLP